MIGICSAAGSAVGAAVAVAVAVRIFVYDADGDGRNGEGVGVGNSVGDAVQAEIRATKHRQAPMIG
jgi:hypothetical protein